jgi:hypothetical protein
MAATTTVRVTSTAPSTGPPGRRRVVTRARLVAEVRGREAPRDVPARGVRAGPAARGVRAVPGARGVLDGRAAPDARGVRCRVMARDSGTRGARTRRAARRRTPTSTKPAQSTRRPPIRGDARRRPGRRHAYGDRGCAPTAGCRQPKMRGRVSRNAASASASAIVNRPSTSSASPESDATDGSVPVSPIFTTGTPRATHASIS